MEKRVGQMLVSMTTEMSIHVKDSSLCKQTWARYVLNSFPAQEMFGVQTQ